MPFRVRFIIFSVWAGVIYFFLTLPMPAYNGPDTGYNDKIIHLILFGILVFLFVAAFRSVGKIPFVFTLLSGIIFSSLYSAACEYLQTFILGRTNSFRDFLAGLAGIFIAAVIAYIYYGKRPA